MRRTLPPLGPHPCQCWSPWPVPEELGGGQFIDLMLCVFALYVGS